MLHDMSLRREIRSSGGFLSNPGSHLLAKRPLKLTYSWLKIGFAFFFFSILGLLGKLRFLFKNLFLSLCQAEVFREEAIGVWA